MRSYRIAIIGALFGLCIGAGMAAVLWLMVQGFVMIAKWRWG